MKAHSIVILAVLLAACAGTQEELGAVAKNDAIEDFITVTQLQSIDMIRARREINHKVITDRHIILSDRKSSYLASFNRRCIELDDRQITPDIRHDRNLIRARFDTYRGCRIERLYELTSGQAKELIDLGEKAEQ